MPGICCLQFFKKSILYIKNKCRKNTNDLDERNTAAPGFDKITKYTEIIIILYELLQLEDQLRLAQVSDDLATIFENFILRATYRSLAVYPNDDYFVVTNETNANRLALKPNVFAEFLRFVSGKLQALSETQGTLIDVRPFRNLTSLSYHNMEVPRQQWQFIADNCRQLESLHIYCCCDEKQEFIVIGKNWSVETLLELKQLKRLHLENGLQVSISYRDLRRLITQLPLESLFLKAAVDPNVDATAEERSAGGDARHLQELAICTTFDAQAFPTSFPSYLANFENLLKLTITFLDYVNDEILGNMAKACINLEILYIEFSTFAKVHKFPIPDKLTELSLFNCRGLTQAHLKHILTELPISKFSSGSIQYEGEFEDFRISPCIQSLDFDDVHTHKFKSAFEGNKNLRELVWYDQYYGYDEGSVATEVPLEKCPNLETLNMEAGFMPLNTLLQLQSLHKLVIPQSMPRLNWSYVTAILKHAPLQEFVMNNDCAARDLQQALDIPVLGFASNVTFVKISEEVFGMALDFWLDLLCHNDALKLEVKNFRGDNEFVETVVNHKNFPKNLKKLDICCFTINCSDLRRNLDATMQKLVEDTNHLRFQYDEELYRLILCRELNRN